MSIMAATSIAATGFLIYNLLAGGNPPKQDKAVTAAESMQPQKAYWIANTCATKTLELIGPF